MFTSHSMVSVKLSIITLGLLLLAPTSFCHATPHDSTITDESCLLQFQLNVQPKRAPAGSKNSPSRARLGSDTETPPPFQALSAQVSDLQTQMNGMSTSLTELKEELVHGPHAAGPQLDQSGRGDDDPVIFADISTAPSARRNALRKLSRSWAQAGLFLPQSWDFWLAANFLVKGAVVFIVVLSLAAALNWLRTLAFLLEGPIKGQGDVKFAKEAGIISYGAVPCVLKELARATAATDEAEGGKAGQVGYENSALEAKLEDGVQEAGTWWMQARSTELLAWQEMIDAGISTYMRQYPTEFRKRSRRGIPDEFRWKVWMAALQCNEQDPVQDFNVLCQMENQWTHLISADICRTFPDEEHFDKSKEEALYRVLNAYANHNPHVGYCQGMNFIAGLLLLVSNDEKESFRVLVRLMHHIGLSGFYGEHLPLLKAYTSAWDQLMLEKMPKLREHFRQEDLDPAIYLHQWFLTLFVHCFPLPMVAVIWDIIICNGLPAILPITEAILHVLADSIQTMRKEDMLDIFAKMKEGKEDSKFNGYRIGHLLMEHLAHTEFPEHIPECLQDAHLQVAQGAAWEDA